MLMAAVLLALIGGGYLAARSQAWQSQFKADQNRATIANVKAIHRALILYAARNQRLPCPADSKQDIHGLTGSIEMPQSNGACQTNAGSVPWRDLGLQWSQALDGNSQKILYHVFDGEAGLTQPGGMAFIACSLEAGLTKAIPCVHPILLASQIVELKLSDPIHNAQEYGRLVSAFQSVTLADAGLATPGFDPNNASGAAFILTANTQTALPTIDAIDIRDLAILSHQWISTTMWPAYQEWPASIQTLFVQGPS